MVLAIIKILIVFTVLFPLFSDKFDLYIIIIIKF
jgi:hypothetical protein